MKIKKGIALALAVALIVPADLSGLLIPLRAFAAVSTENQDGMIEIRSFEPLEPEVLKQTVHHGTEITEINLPSELTVRVSLFEDEESDSPDLPVASEAVAQEKEENTQNESKEITISDVEWSVVSVPDPEGETEDILKDGSVYDGDSPGDYVFTPVVDELQYVLASSAVKPEITVTVEEISTRKMDVSKLGRVMMLDTETVKITVYETGILQKLVENTEGYEQDKITDLTIVTEAGVFLDTQDFKYMRTCLPNLTRLDIAEADCLNDTDPSNPVEYEIPPRAMADHKRLETIVLSETATSIGERAFLGCIGLRGDLVIPERRLSYS